MSKDKTFRVVVEMTVTASGVTEGDQRAIDEVKLSIAKRAKQLEHWNYWFSSHINNIKIEDM